MELITKTSILKGLAQRYQQQYAKNMQFRDGSWSDSIVKRLSEETDLTEEKAAEIIGNKSWTRNSCNECGEDVFAVVQLGEEPDYESATAKVCVNCLNTALALIEQTNK